MPAAIRMVHDVDPKEEILREVGQFVEGIHVPAARILLAIYKRPEKTKSNILLPGNQGTRVEDEWQGKASLVLKFGPLAFQEDETHRFGGVIPKLHDWVMCTPGDAFNFMLGERRCRIVEDVSIHAIIPEPDIVL